MRRLLRSKSTNSRERYWGSCRSLRRQISRKLSLTAHALIKLPFSRMPVSRVGHTLLLPVSISLVSTWPSSYQPTGLVISTELILTVMLHLEVLNAQVTQPFKAFTLVVPLASGFGATTPPKWLYRPLFSKEGPILALLNLGRTQILRKSNSLPLIGRRTSAVHVLPVTPCLILPSLAVQLVFIYLNSEATPSSIIHALIAQVLITQSISVVPMYPVRLTSRERNLREG